MNDAPVAVADAYTTAEDTPLNIPAPGLLGNDSDVDGDVLTTGLVTSPTHGALTLNANGSFVVISDLGDHGGIDAVVMTHQADIFDDQPLDG